MSEIPDSVRMVPGYLRHIEEGDFDAADALLWGSIRGVEHAGRMIFMQAANMQNFAEAMQNNLHYRKKDCQRVRLEGWQDMTIEQCFMAGVVVWVFGLTLWAERRWTNE